MAKQIPSLLEIAQSALVPKYLKNINSEHQIGKTAKGTEELVRINRDLLLGQTRLASEWIESQSAIMSSVDVANEHLRRLSADLAGIQATLTNLTIAYIKGLERIDFTILRGFNLLAEGLRQVINVQEEERNLLEKISKTLSEPHQTRINELRREADAKFENSLRNNNENQIRNLRTALDLYTEIVEREGILGKLDYFAWFQIGWLKWNLDQDYLAAKSAFDEAQRLSDGKDDAFRAKSLRHLARMHFLLSNFEEARSAISRSLTVRFDDAHALHDAALYHALCGLNQHAFQYLSAALAREPLLYISTLFDPEFARVAGVTQELLNRELSKQYRLVSFLLDNMKAVADRIATIWFSSKASAPPSNVQLFISELSTTLARASEGGDITLRQILADFPALADLQALALRDTNDGLNSLLLKEERELKTLEENRYKARTFLQARLEELRKSYSQENIKARDKFFPKGIHPQNLLSETFDYTIDNREKILAPLLVSFLVISIQISRFTDGFWWIIFCSVALIIAVAIVLYGVISIVYSRWYYRKVKLAEASIKKDLDAIRMEHAKEVEKAKEQEPHVLAAAETQFNIQFKHVLELRGMTDEVASLFAKSQRLGENWRAGSPSEGPPADPTPAASASSTAPPPASRPAS